MRILSNGIRLSVALALACAVITACEKEDNNTGVINDVLTVPIQDTLQPVISENTLLTNAHPWYIRGWVYLGNEAVLKIEPGTVINMCPDEEAGGNGGLIITRGAKIVAQGLPQLPIHFQRSDSGNNGWRGIIILGRATQQKAFTTFEHEMLPAGKSLAYGGNEPDDSSGVLQHVQIDYVAPVKGKQPTPGLLLLGAGKKTNINNVVLHPLNINGASLNDRRLP
ncbi:hypothetical protein F0L74_17405 [Chitinophaga agrisoli]|uniref:Uncharacterized protein n=1 Tax=Chitinophaga agrisoli TaxID=2607653 RepID=A0A5B2VRH6_9BACT|nr:hypothetical protein [Chitinophaga agrisoli]KAA2241655.1 hypothetical protein F0L74_17405 [Chitinophaga agrisoli]